MDKTNFEVVDQDVSVVLERTRNEKVISRPNRELKEPTRNNTDKPGVLVSKLAETTRGRLELDAQEILHGFHLNGRNIDNLHQRTSELLSDSGKVKLILAKAPQIKDGTELQLMNAMFIKWSETIFSFLGKTKPDGDYIVFVKDVKSDNFYLPCCHDIKPVPAKQLINHFSSCLASKIDGSKCSFCNTTDLLTGNYGTVDNKQEHLIGNNHINSIYLVLDHVEGGLRMVDVRTVDNYILTRPFSNYFLKEEAQRFGINGLIDFLKQHFYVQNLERTPLYATLLMYQRLAKNKKRDFFRIPCIDCDNTFPAYTGFYLGKILNLDRVECDCGAENAYKLPLAKIAEIYDLVKQAMQKDNSTAGKSLLLALFQTVKVPDTGAANLNSLNIAVSEIDNAMKLVQSSSNLTVVSGAVTATSSKDQTNIEKFVTAKNHVTSAGKGKSVNQTSNVVKAVGSSALTTIGNYGNNGKRKDLESMDITVAQNKTKAQNDGNDVGSKKMVITRGPSVVQLRSGVKVKTTLVMNDQPYVPTCAQMALVSNINNELLRKNWKEINSWYEEKLKCLDVLDDTAYKDIKQAMALKFGT